MTASAARLDGRRVAVTRGKGGDDALTVRLRELGAEVLEFPSIAVGPPESFAELDAALRCLHTFDAAAFASVNAVEHTAARLAALGVPAAALAALRLAAVGPATAEALARAVRPPDLVPSAATGAALGAALAVAARGRRILVPRAAEGRPELMEMLQAAGAAVVAPVAYRTVPVPPESLAPLGAMLEQGEIDAVTFASPSAVRSVASALGARAALIARVCVAVIGPTTAEAVRALGWPVSAEPALPGAAALAEAVAERLNARR